VADGHAVTWLASGFPGGAGETSIGGIRVVRRGSWWNFNAVVPGMLRGEFARPAPDLVIEDVNKVPCFTPLFTKAPVSVIVPHLFGTTAFLEVSWPQAAYVTVLESWIPAVYRGRPFVAISESTRDDLVARGVARDRIAVIHCGIDHATFRPDPATAKASVPTILFLGRLRRYKGLDLVLRALPIVRRAVPEVRLAVVGDGPYREPLERLARELGLAGAVEFTGFVPSDERVRRLRAAHVTVQPSPKEGWGLTVIEANACGTAVVASRSPGLRDAVREGESGLLVPHGDVGALAEALVRVLTDPALRAHLEQGGLAWAARFRWEECARCSLQALGVPVGGRRGDA
jgi:glycosyltransferase involved in cell wall biosynthesis